MLLTRRTSPRLGLIFAFLSSAVACSSSQGLTGPSPQSANAVSALVSPEVTIFNVGAAGVPTDGRGPCLLDHGGGFGCGNARRDGLTFTRTVTFFDANGTLQSAFDATTTASIKTETSVTGTTTNRDGGTVTVNRTGVMVVSGLAGAETTHTLNGSEQGTVAVTGTSPGGGAFTTNTTVRDSTNNLVVPAPARDAGRDPGRGFALSGSRAHATTTTTTRGGETHTDTLSRIETFDGTSTVQVQLTINGVTQNCTTDLSGHTSTCHR